MRAFLRRLFGREAPAAAAPEAPLTSIERAKLDRERRMLERNLRHMRKRLHARGCSTCPTAEDPRGVAMWKRKSDLEDRLGNVEARLIDG